MALDKLVDSIELNSNLTSVANAIRSKGGTTSTILFPSGFISAIESIKTKEEVTWSQCPTAVKDYMEGVTYDPSDYSYTEVMDYAPTPTVASNTKPIGHTVDNVTYYNNVPNSNTPFASTNKAGTLKPIDQVRWINSVTNNFRDIGGWTCDNGNVRYGLVYRSGDISASDEDLILNQLGIRTEVDLTADGTPAFVGKMRFVGHTSYAMYSLSNIDAWRVNLRGVIESVVHGDPVIIHCSMGADRTGTLACVLEGILGMSQSDIDKDYELTSFYAMRARNGNYQGGTSDWSHLISAINAFDGNNFRDKCVSFALSVGITIDEINAYRSAMINGTPDVLLPTVPSCSISDDLTNCVSNNASVSINKWQPYGTYITPQSGYKLNNINVTMGDTNVTPQCITHETYPNDRYIVSISRVTGNIVISASAIEDSTLVNQIPISIDTDSSVYNGTGYREGYRLNSSGTEASMSGYVVTGFIPFTQGKTIYFDKFNGSESSNGGFYFYDDSFAKIAVHRCGRMISDGELVSGQTITYTPAATIYDDGAGSNKDISSSAYVRISVKSSAPGDLVCRIN